MVNEPRAREIAIRCQSRAAATLQARERKEGEVEESPKDPLIGTNLWWRHRETCIRTMVRTEQVARGVMLRGWEKGKGGRIAFTRGSRKGGKEECNLWMEDQHGYERKSVSESTT